MDQLNNSRPVQLKKCPVCPATLEGSQHEFDRHVNRSHQSIVVRMGEIVWIKRRPQLEAIYLGRHYR